MPVQSGRNPPDGVLLANSTSGTMGPVSMRLLEKRPVSDERYWTPFDSCDGYNEGWWCRAGRFDARYRYFSAVANGPRGFLEVARVQLDDIAPRVLDYSQVPTIRGFVKEIERIEVHLQYRRQGVGAAVIELVADAFPSHRLVALSASDRFWESLGWSRHVHSEDRDGHARHWPLYVRPS